MQLLAMRIMTLATTLTPLAVEMQDVLAACVQPEARAAAILVAQTLPVMHLISIMLLMKWATSLVVITFRAARAAVAEAEQPKLNRAAEAQSWVMPAFVRPMFRTTVMRILPM